MATSMHDLMTRLEPEVGVLMFYRKATREWRDELVAEQDRQRELLNDPAYLASLGLPAEMPPEALDILKVTMAADAVGPRMPKLSTYAEKFGR